jgi:hypothetical protein
MLAFLIGSPLCCCVAKGCGGTASGPRPSCCEKAEPSAPGKKAPERHVCSCRTKEPRDFAKAFELPGDAGVPLPVEVAQRIELPAPAITTPVVARHFFPGSDPPRARLARFSRWLI